VSITTTSPLVLDKMGGEATNLPDNEEDRERERFTSTPFSREREGKRRDLIGVSFLKHDCFDGTPGTRIYNHQETAVIPRILDAC
jgi:hypothetical protein